MNEKIEHFFVWSNVKCNCKIEKLSCVVNGICHSTANASALIMPRVA